MSEISHALFVDLTEPENPKQFAVTDLSKKLIEWVGLDVIRFRRNQQVAYRIVDHCRETYDKINGVINVIDEGTDDEADYDKFTLYTDAVDALEEYLFKLVLTSELETSHYFAKTETIHDCISGATLWSANRQRLREAASDFTAQEKLLGMFDQGKKLEMDRGFVEAAQDDDVAFYTDLRVAIEAHALVDVTTQARYDLNAVVQTLIQETITAISTLGDAITRDNEVERKKQRQTLGVQFLFILHGLMEIVIDPSEEADADWRAHLKSRDVWTAAKAVAEHLNLDNKPHDKWADWVATYEAFVQAISNPGCQVPVNWLKLVKLSAKIHRPYLSRAWAIVVLSKNLVNFFNTKGNTVPRNIEPLERTFDRAISVLELASRSWDNATTKYDLASYDTHPVISAFTNLENEIKERYTLLKSGEDWATAEGILRTAVAKDKQRIELMNARIDRVTGAEDTTKDDKLIEVTVKSSVASVKETKIRVSHTTRLSAIRYSLSRPVTDETARKDILVKGRFEGGHTLDMDIQSICKEAKSCELNFAL